MTGGAPAPVAPKDLHPTVAPPIARRLACFVYEGVLLFGVVMAAGLIYGVATGQSHAMLGRSGLQALLFVVLGAYFTWFWSRGGQTLAMKTWRIRLVRADGASVPPLRCAMRYLLAWVWFVPALVALRLADHPGGWVATGAVAAGVTGYALLARLRADRQFWHDAACGTRLVDAQIPAPAARRAVR